MEGKWLPNNIFPDVVLGEARNRKLIQEGKRELPIDFCPVPYKKEGILWWHVPEFLEDNKDNLTYDENAGYNNWDIRINALEDFYEEKVAPYLKIINEGQVWTKQYTYQDEDTYVDEDKRDEIILKAYYLAGASCNGRMGYAISGLYLDFEKFKELFTLSPDEAERIIDNNIFVGDMATFYTASVENGESVDRCEFLKQQYTKTLNKVANNPEIHLNTKYKVQEPLTLNFKGDQKIEYEDMLKEHLDTLNKFSRKSAIEPL